MLLLLKEKVTKKKAADKKYIKVQRNNIKKKTSCPSRREEIERVL